MHFKGISDKCSWLLAQKSPNWRHNYYFRNTDFEQIATAGADTATASKFSRKWDTAHVRRLRLAVILVPRASISSGLVVGEMEGSGRVFSSVDR